MIKAIFENIAELKELIYAWWNSNEAMDGILTINFKKEGVELRLLNNNATVMMRILFEEEGFTEYTISKELRGYVEFDEFFKIIDDDIGFFEIGYNGKELVINNGEYFIDYEEKTIPYPVFDLPRGFNVDFEDLEQYFSLDCICNRIIIFDLNENNLHLSNNVGDFSKDLSIVTAQPKTKIMLMSSLVQLPIFFHIDDVIKISMKDDLSPVMFTQENYGIKVEVIVAPYNPRGG